MDLSVYTVYTLESKVTRQFSILQGARRLIPIRASEAIDISWKKVGAPTVAPAL